MPFRIHGVPPMDSPSTGDHLHDGEGKAARWRPGSGSKLAFAAPRSLCERTPDQPYVIPRVGTQAFEVVGRLRGMERKPPGRLTVVRRTRRLVLPRGRLCLFLKGRTAADA